MTKRILNLLTILVMIISLIGFLTAINNPPKTYAVSTGYVEYTSVDGIGLPPRQYVNSNSYFFVSDIIPSRNGYTFKYWKTVNGNIYMPSSQQYFGNGALILYAVWEADTYTIKYDANGGIGAPDMQIKTHNKTLNLSKTKPTRYGYTFLGWGKSVNTSTVSYNPGSVYSSNASIILYAVWIKSYTVKYIANGGLYAPEEQIKIQGKTLILSKSEPTRIGYKFKGWGINADDTLILYKPGAKYTDNASITLYAIWEKSYENKAKPTDSILNSTTYINTNSINKVKTTQSTNSAKPYKVKSVKLTAKKKKLNVKWKKVSGATGYEVMYAKNNKFKGKKTVKVKKNKITLKRLKSKKKYYVKVRAYKTVNGNTSYGKWSKVVKKKVK